MKIAYRRMSGPIGLTSVETGTRGLWFEKRLALVAALKGRGHEVDFINRFTKYTAGAVWETEFSATSHDVLVIEFGSGNTQFYGKDLARTQEMVTGHRGRVIFLCDDPDLPYLWKTVPVSDYSRWSVWMNAFRPQPFGGAPEGIRHFDAPFASLFPGGKRPIEPEEKTLVYIGRPNGRTKVLKEILGKVSVVICGRAAEWREFSGAQVPRVFAPPEQSERATFYSRYLGCLVLADAKHKRLGWRTGRAYHALYAGCPAVVEHDHDALKAFPSFRDAAALNALVERWSTPGVRLGDWKLTFDKVSYEDRRIMDETFAAAGL